MKKMYMPAVCIMQREFRFWRMLCELFIFVEYNERDENEISILLMDFLYYTLFSLFYKHKYLIMAF